MYELEKRIIDLESRFNQLVRVGTVASADPAKGTARVYLPDSDGMESYSLPVLFQKTQDDKHYSIPDKGEQVLCVFLPNGLEQGFIIGAFYSDKDTVTVPNKDITRVDFANGAFLEHNRETGLFSVSIQGNIDIKATGNIAINGHRIDLN